MQIVRFENKTKAKLLQSMIRTSVLILAASLAMVAATIAWFASNRNVQSSGMEMSVDCPANLVTAPTEEELRLITGMSESVMSITLTKPTAHTITRFKPASHILSGATSKVGVGSNLYYATNAQEIDPSTGMHVNIGESISTGSVAPEANSPYYVDYVFYLGSLAKSISGANVQVEFITEPKTDEEILWQNAVSIDFYVEDDYTDTINLAGYDYRENDYSTPKLYASLGELDIPLNTTGGISITMRCYFDGALLKSENQAFIATNNVSTDNLSFAVHLSATGGAE